MNSRDKFIRALSDAFPDERLTYQKGIPTFHPENVSEAAKLIALAGERRQKLYITGFGNIIDPLGTAFDDLIVLRTDRLGQLIDVNESELSVVVGAGFPLREINAKIESAGLFLPIGELPFVGSVGGAIAVGLSASLDEKHWEQRPIYNEHRADTAKNQPPQISIERYILRLDIAIPTGETKSYGVQSAKQPHAENYARIFSPSWGLLGFIACAKFRVAPLSAKEEYQNMRQSEISLGQFLRDNSETNSGEARYFSQLRRKFDPHELFPIIGARETK